MYENHLYFSLNAGHFNWSLIYKCFLRVKVVTSAFPRRLCTCLSCFCFMTKKNIFLPPPAVAAVKLQQKKKASSRLTTQHLCSEALSVAAKSAGRPLKLGSGPIEPSAWGKTKVSWKRPSVRKSASGWSPQYQLEHYRKGFFKAKVNSTPNHQIQWVSLNALSKDMQNNPIQVLSWAQTYWPI